MPGAVLFIVRIDPIGAGVDQAKISLEICNANLRVHDLASLVVYLISLDKYWQNLQNTYHRSKLRGIPCRINH